MSRTTVLIVAILCLIFGANIGLAQGLYLTANAGFGLGAGTQVLDLNYSQRGPTGTVDMIFGSFGEGFRFGVSAGYMFNEHIGTELGISYWLGTSFDNSLRTSVNMATGTRRGLGFVATPSIVLSTTMKPISPYARIGVVLGIMRIQGESKSEQPGQTIEINYEENGGFAFGYSGALGMVIPTGGAVDIFLEAGFQVFTFSPRQSETTAYTVNGINQLDLLPQKVFEFKDSFSDSEMNSGPAVRRPFSAVGGVMGVRINL
jgi:hypothetical protein